MKFGNIGLTNIKFGDIQISRRMYGDKIIWENIKWAFDMIITDEQIADVYDFEHVFPDETDGSTTLKGIVTDIDHQPFQAKYEFANISNAVDVDILVTDSPIQDGDNLVIVKDDDSIHELVASGVTGTGPYTMDTSAITQGEVPSKAFTVDAKASFAISGGYVDAEKESVQSSLVYYPIGTETIEINDHQTFVVPAGVTSLDLCMIGGGGSGRDYADTGRVGGAAGQIINQAVAVTEGESIDIVIGLGGSGATGHSPGAPTSFGAITATGGGLADYLDGEETTNCKGTFNNGLTKSYALKPYGGGEAGFSDGGDGTSGVKAGTGSGSGANTGSFSGDGGDGQVNISYPLFEKGIGQVVEYKNLIDNTGSLTISPKVTLKSVSDKMIELRGSIAQ